MTRIHFFLACAAAAGLITATATAAPFFFSTGEPDGRVGIGSRPSSGAKMEIESADDFIVPGAQTAINGASFTGLLPTGTNLATGVLGVVVEIYQVFPKSSQNPPVGKVPTRINSPSDVEFVGRDSASGGLSFTATLLSPGFFVDNSVANSIHAIPNQTTGGEGPVMGDEARFDVTFVIPFVLPPDHYFFVPQVELTSGDFLWLSAPRPLIGGTGPFAQDLQSWIRSADLDPDWLRVATDVIGRPPTFNASFSLTGVTIPEPSPLLLVLAGLPWLAWPRSGERCRHGITPC